MHSHRITQFVLSSTENTHPPMLFGKRFKIWNFFNTGHPTVPDLLPAPPPPHLVKDSSRFPNWIHEYWVHVSTFLAKSHFFWLNAKQYCLFNVLMFHVFVWTPSLLYEQRLRKFSSRSSFNFIYKIWIIRRALHTLL